MDIRNVTKVVTYINMYCIYFPQDFALQVVSLVFSRLEKGDTIKVEELCFKKCFFSLFIS